MTNSFNRRNFIKSVAGALAFINVSKIPNAYSKESHRILKENMHFEFLSSICELILPTSESKGASEPETIAFVIKAFRSEIGPFKYKQIGILKEKLEINGVSFENLKKKGQVELLTEIDKSAYSPNSSKLTNVDLAWISLKCAVIAGYYTGKIGASEELKYDPVPGNFYNFELENDYVQTSNNAFGFPIGML